MHLERFTRVLAWYYIVDMTANLEAVIQELAGADKLVEVIKE